jgi:hypothetical protein
VRWVLSFQPLPDDQVRPRAQAALPEVAEPLRLYEIPDVLPRAFWVPRCEVVPGADIGRRLESDPRDDAAVLLREPPPGNVPCGPPAGVSGTVSMERPDAHTVRLTAGGDAGFLVVLEGHHPAWRAVGPEGEVPVLLANERYWALPTPGGDRTYVVRYRPGWVAPSVVVSAAALAVSLLLVALQRRS